jgi:hypothetical protein
MTGHKIDLNETDVDMNFALAKRQRSNDIKEGVRESDLGQVMVTAVPK